jgi:predicted anti-sigma-YlaC factor YlaD
MTFGDHVSDDRLEEYCLGTVPAAALEEVESHLLVCASCRQRLSQTEAYVDTVRQAAAHVEAEREARDRRRREALRRWFRPVPLAIAAGVAAIVVVWGVIWNQRGAPAGPPIAVTLEANRGGGEAGRAHVPAHRALRVSLDLTGLAALDTYRLTVVSAAGDPVAESLARPESGRVVLAIPRGLARGTHWIRVFDPRAPGVLLREFGLELE